jgi:hypothetical protein
MAIDLPVINLAEVKFDCTFGRGCDGPCCREGRPPVYPEEIARIEENLKKFLPLMRAKAKRALQRAGFLVPRRRRLKERMLRVVDRECVFFNQGCVLHQAGADEGDKYRYKPSICALFPIQQDKQDRWYIRQKGFKREKWDLFCLDSANSHTPAAVSLHDEIALAKRFDDEDKAKK